MTPAEIAELARYATHFKQRFGQFIINCIPHQVGFGHDSSLFYVTDDELLQYARTYYIENKRD